jgi:hypothetical protein
MNAKTHAIRNGVLTKLKQPGVRLLQIQNIVKAGPNNHAYTHTRENAVKEKILKLLKNGNMPFLKVLANKILAKKIPNLVDNNGRFLTHKIAPSTLYKLFENDILNAKQKNEQNNTSRKFGTLTFPRVMKNLLGQNAFHNFMKRKGGLGPNYALTGNRNKTVVPRGKFARMFGLPQKKLNLTEMLHNNLPPKRSFFAKSRGLPRRNRRNRNNFNSI